MSESDVVILLIDDDEVDRRAITRALRKRRIGNSIVEARDGVEGLAILRGEQGYEKITRPYLILLDLNMPRLGGIEFLQEVRKDPALHDSIIFVLTTSDDQKDKTAAYEQIVAGYILKTDQAGGEFVQLVTMLEYFVVTVQFPEES